MSSEEYLTVAELAARLKLAKKTIKNKMASGDFIEGIHFFKPKGMAPRFKWSAVQAWIEGGKETSEAVAVIPLKKGTVLKIPVQENKRTANGL